jgi:hypothetical protein
MGLLVICLAAMALLFILLKAVRRRLPRAEQPEGGTACANESACAQAGASCMHDCVMEQAVKEIVYFDDEELDAYKGRKSDSYTDEEAAQFAEVLYTMRPSEVKDWTASLTLRGISMPDQIKDEAIMLMEG